jgi:hypothetical protein
MMEIILRGKPWEFAHTTKKVSLACGLPGLTVSDPRGTPEEVTFSLRVPGPPETVTVQVRKPYTRRSRNQTQPEQSRRRTWFRAAFVAISLPGDRTLVTIQAQDEDWQQLAPFWDATLVALERLGFIVPIDEDAPRGHPAPPIDERELPNRWQPRSAADRWLIEQYFDVYKEGRGLGTFIDEWVRLRIDEGTGIPGNPKNSMAGIISKERGRRGGE